jgi:hypothetical protein
MSRLRWFHLVGAGLLVLGIGCGIAVRRDLSAIPPGQVGFDDMCGLQEYFDALEIKTVPAPRVVSALDLEGTTGGKVVHGGKERYAFENEFQLKHLRRVLDENWRRLPEPIANATAIEIEVRWSEKAGAKRVVTDQPAELTVGKESWPLPYHPCLSELLYGAPLYRQRREMWHLPLPGMGSGGGPVDAAPPPTSMGPLFGDGGTVDGHLGH